MTERKHIRRTKVELFYDQQIDILNKFNEILNITETQNYFIMNDLEVDKEKINQILNLENEIKKYFKCNRWSYFNNGGDYLALIKSFYKAMHYDVIYKIKMIDKKRLVLYYIIKQL